MRPIAYGIDFGTTNSSIAIAYDDHVEVVKPSRHGIREVLPSIVYLHRDGIRAAGEEAVQQYLVTGSRQTRCGSCSLVERYGGETFTECKQYKRGGGCQDARIATELKSSLAEAGEGILTHSWAVDFDLADFVAVILRDLKRAADRVCGESVRRAVIGYPVLFVGAEGRSAEHLQKRALKGLVEASTKAGFEEIDFLEEPAAAAVDEELQTGTVVVVDFGGGTFDVAVVELSPDQGEVLALQGAAVGGEEFSGKLFTDAVAPHLGLDGTVYGVPAWVRQRLRTLAGVLRVLSDRDVPGLLRDAARASEEVAVLLRILYGGHAYHFYRSIEDAKVALSSNDSASIEFHRPEIDLSIAVTREAFERLIADDLQIVRRQILAALEQAAVSPERVDAVLMTGGSSGIPAFIDLLGELFGADKVHERPAYTSVVHGLASYARGRWSA